MSAPTWAPVDEATADRMMRDLIALDPLLKKMLKVQGDCLIWLGARATDGRYGKLGRNGRMLMAYRYTYGLIKGAIPPGLVIDHLCRVTLCVNPAHLEAVTQQENVRRATTNFASINGRKTHCIRGHAFTPENTYFYVPRKSRRCRACDAEAKRRQRVA